MKAPGYFLTVDGPGGVGKSTTVTAITHRLREAGHTVHPTTEPSGSALGIATRRLAQEVRGTALALLVAADRHHHLDTEIRPHLAAGHTVVCDRYLASSLVLQRLDGVPAEFIRAINTGITLPDLAVVLTAPAPTITRRLHTRGSHHRFEDDPDNVTRELDLYEQAITTLQDMAIPVLRLDTDTITPASVAAAIVHATGITSARVTPDHVPPPEQRTWTPPPQSSTYTSSSATETRSSCPNAAAPTGMADGTPPPANSTPGRH
ncbi:dTMP kinase [Embleya sp. NPDC020630]|uniref:dTMP kinase n=1 Tax=Embleya sp. NPDC020630 TaxID=3363979 RepID=UPI0037A8D76D